MFQHVPAFRQNGKFFISKREIGENSLHVYVRVVQPLAVEYIIFNYRLVYGQYESREYRQSR